VFDVLERVTYVEAADQDARIAHGLTGLDPDAILVDMHAVAAGKVYRGFAAYRALVMRVPIRGRFCRSSICGPSHRLASPFIGGWRIRAPVASRTARWPAAARVQTRVPRAAWR
jgi:hypothetical protein